MADATRTCPRGPSQPWGRSRAQRERDLPRPNGVGVCARRNADVFGGCGGRECQGVLAATWRGRPCRRGLPICHEHEDCRRSLALGVACAEGR